MLQKKRFIILFLLCLYGVFLFYPIKHVLLVFGVENLVKTDNWQTFNKKTESNILDKIENKIGLIKNELENRIINYFPFYIDINRFSATTNYKLNSLIYQENVPVGINIDKESVFFNTKYNFFFVEMYFNEKEATSRLNKQLQFFNNLSNRDIEIYVYLPTRYDLTSLKENNYSRYVDKFINGLKENIKVMKSDVNNIDEYKNNFFISDHHWTMRGALSGYYNIMQLLEEAQIENLNIVCDPQIKFHGSMPKTSMLLLNDDRFCDVDIHLDYDTLINGQRDVIKYKPRKVGYINSNPFFDYYVKYFNGLYGEVIFDYHDIEKENLLILSDSYSWPIDYLIAASFNKTHIINMLYDKYENNEFNLSEYVVQNDINKVLFLYEGVSTVFDPYNYGLAERIK